MSTTITKDDLKQAFAKSGNAWLFDYWGNDTDFYLDRALEQIEKFADEYERRFQERPDPFQLLQDNPLVARAFFQPDTFSVSLEMKIMIWRILLGCEIQHIEFQYDLEGETKLAITLRTPHAEFEDYHGQPGDFRVFRHFGLTGNQNRLVLQGYYALKS